VKKKNGETWYQNHLVDQELHQLLEKVDADLAQEACQKGCLHARESCIGPITIANRVVARNGSDAIAIVVPKKIAGDGELRSRCVSWGEGSDDFQNNRRFTYLLAKFGTSNPPILQ
jgi:hypothetical protein